MSGRFLPGACLAAFSCGVILLYSLAVVPPLPWLIILTCLPLLLYSYLPKPSRKACWLLIASSVGVGLSWSAWHADQRIHATLPPVLEGQVLSVSGYVCELPSRGSFNSVRFSFCVNRWEPAARETLTEKQELPAFLRLAWYGQGATTEMEQSLTLKVALKRPHGSVNPAGFRYESWLFRQGYGATGTVRDIASAESVSCGLHCQYHQWRRQLAASVERAFGEAQQFPLIASLLMGNRGHMEPSHWEVLKATGTIHLVAISGLHLGLVALATGFLVRRLWLWLPEGWVSPAAARYLTFISVALVALVYALAAGFTVPTRRALVMVVTAGWVIVRARHASPWRGLLISLFLVLAMDTFSPLDQGFWLSFGAVGVLIVTYSQRFRMPGVVGGLALAQLSVFAGLWPVLAMLDQPQVLSGLLANLFAIPWVSFVVMPALFAGAALQMLFPWLQGPVSGLFDLVLGVLWQVLSLLASIEAPEMRSTMGVSLALAGVVLATVMVPSRLARLVVTLCVFAWLGMLLGVDGKPEDKRLNAWVSDPEFWVWDVGQGLSVMLRHQDKVMLYDTGPELAGVYSAVDSVLVPNLTAMGVQTIDTLVVSHGDSDHAGGLMQLYSAFDVGHVISGEPERVAGKLAAGPMPEACVTTDERAVGDFRVRFWQSSSQGNANDTSCVLIITSMTHGVTFVLTGDITERGEADLLTTLSAPGAGIPNESYRVLVAPHHGSNTSSSPAWVNFLEPHLVIYSAGYRHRFGHPHPDVVARYREAGSVSLNTAYSGAIRVALGNSAVTIDQTRDSQAFWIRPPETDWLKM